MFLRVEKALSAALVAIGVATSGTALAQGIPTQTVTWTVEPQNIAKTDRGILILHGTVASGWHVYSLKQAPEGPTPLVISVAANAVATVDGVATGSAPEKIHDPAFNLETQFYSGAFTLSVPVRFARHVAGQQTVPVDVRFQTCNGKVCEPPKIVRLSAPVNFTG